MYVSEQPTVQERRTHCYRPSFPAVQPNATSQTERYKEAWGTKCQARMCHIKHEDMRHLKESAIISPTTPQCLLYNIWFHVTLYFCGRGREGQRNLTKSSFIFLQDENNKWYATMAHDESSKTCQGGIDDIATN